jgi:hypothetical protein
MKKLLLLGAILLLLSCEGPIGPPGEPGSPLWEQAYYTVKSNDWELVGREDGLNSYYRYIFDEPLLSHYIYSSGVVLGYLVVNPGTKDELLRPLPDDLPLGERIQQSDVLWTQYLTFDYQVGSVAFYVSYSDFATSVQPSEMTFKLVMMW